MYRHRWIAFDHDCLDVSVSMEDGYLMLRVEDDRGNATVGRLSELVSPKQAYALLGNCLKDKAGELA